MSSISKTAICPFYKSDSKKNGKRYLNCEGFINNKTISTFMGENEFKSYTDQFCCKENWQNCTYAQFCLNKYL